MTQVVNKTGQSTPSLILYPRDTHYAWNSHKDTLRSLHLMGLIGEPYGNSGVLYLVGEEFLSLVTFLGCAPSVRIEPRGDDRNPCMVEIPAATLEPVLQIGANVKPVLCPHCRARIKAKAGAAQIGCGTCKTLLPAATLNWRRSGCFARVWINIRGVHESEAVPTTRLLDQLNGYSAVRWDYCYLR